MFCTQLFFISLTSLSLDNNKRTLANNKMILFSERSHFDVQCVLVDTVIIYMNLWYTLKLIIRICVGFVGGSLSSACVSLNLTIWFQNLQYQLSFLDTLI